MKNKILAYVYNDETSIKAPTDFIEDQGMVAVWEEKKYFVVMPTKLVVGRGKVTDLENRKPQILHKKDGWKAIYEGVY